MKGSIKIVSTGGLGDALLATPSFKALKEAYPDKRIVVYYRTPAHKEIYANNPYIHEFRILKKKHYFLHLFRLLKFRFINYGAYKPSKCYEIGASEIIADMLGVKLADKTIQLFITQQEYEKAKEFITAYPFPIGINPTSRTTKNQEWVNERWEQLIKEFPGVTFLQFGLQDEPALKGAKDFRGKLPFREIMAIFKYLKGFVGAESVFGHLAHAAGIPGVILFGPSHPTIWGHRSNKNIFKNLPCAPCVDVLLNAACPYGRPCMTSISLQEVKEAVFEHILSKYLQESATGTVGLY